MPFLSKRTFQQLPAFIFLGIAIALTIGLFIVFTYVLLWGILLGSLFWLCALIKQYFSTSSTYKNNKNNKNNHGRIIDYDNKK